MSEESELAWYKARCFVHGMVDEIIAGGVVTGRKVPHAGHWAARFLDHPWVKAAEEEGWSMELRAPVVRTVALRIMAKRPLHDITELMPDEAWIKHTRINAKRYADAKAWRDSVMAPGEKFDDYLRRSGKGDRVSAKPVGDYSRKVFKEMQRTSPNQHFHRTFEGQIKLTERSMRMSGDDK